MIDPAVWKQLDGASGSQSVVLVLPAVSSSEFAGKEARRQSQDLLISRQRAAAAELLADLPEAIKANLLEMTGHVVLTGPADTLTAYLRNAKTWETRDDIKIRPNQRYPLV